MDPASHRLRMLVVMALIGGIGWGMNPLAPPALADEVGLLGATVLPIAMVSRSTLPLSTSMTSTPNVDEDFADQGEYVGQVLNRTNIAVPVGLQIVAFGDGKFEGLWYPGGLPGAGGQSTQARPLRGERHGTMVRLTGRETASANANPADDDLVIELQSGAARISRQPATGTAAEWIGTLTRFSRVSPTLGARPPQGAIVLFDGSSTARWKNGQINDEGYLQVGTETLEAWSNFTLHAEFRVPYQPKHRDQQRGNSGFYLQRRYEVQVLDSFGRLPQDFDAGALYRFKAPLVNACLPPLTWQTYDLHFRAPTFAADGTKCCPGRISVWHNGICVQSDTELTRKTGAGKPEGPTSLPLLLQDHGDPVVFRNLWLIDHDACATTTYALPSPQGHRRGWARDR